MISSLPRDSQLENTTLDPIQLVFLPGLHGTAELFCALNSALTEQLEVRFSPEVSFTKTLINYPTDIPQSYASLKQWLIEEIQLEKKLNIVLVAESFSSPLALMLAEEFTAQIRAVILGAGFCSRPTIPNLSFLPFTPLFALKPPPFTIRYFLSGEYISSELVTRIRNTISNIPARILSERLKNVIQLEKPLTNKTKTPCLLFQAQADTLIDEDAQLELEQHLPHAETCWLNAPHLIFQTHPEACADRIVTFLTD